MKTLVRKKELIRKIAIGMLLPVSVLMSAGTVYAAEEADVFTLDPIVVTAQRYATRDIDTPAAVSVYTQEQLKATGATSVIEALKYSEGIIYHAQGPLGNAQGTMTSKVIIRGVEKGTLVLIDGVPLNLHGRYNLEDIPLDDIEKIEVIRGGGSVLYGSEATGGVINIISKSKKSNSITVAAGSHGVQNHNLSLQTGKFGINYSINKTDEIDHISGGYTRSTAAPTSSSYVPKRYYDFSGNDREALSWRYTFNDNWDFSHSYGTSDSTYFYRHAEAANKATLDSLSSTSNFDTTYNRMQLNYKKDNAKATFYLNQKELDNTKTEYWKTESKKYQQLTTPVITSGAEKDRTIGLDMQNTWKFKEDTLLIGINAQRESFDSKEKVDNGAWDSRGFDRNVYSVYGQYDHKLDPSANIIISARETWTSGAVDDKNYNKFTPQLQYLKKLEENTSFYASAGMSFMMPTFTQIYGTAGRVKGNPLVKPQQGKHYEVGLKRNTDNHAWRLAVFNYEIDDSISTTYTESSDSFSTTNEDIKNTGIELSCTIDNGGGWHSNWGVSYSNPQKYETDKTGASEGWHRYYGKLQLNGGVNYANEKWKAALTATYLADRERDIDAGGSIKPMLLTGATVSYQLAADREVFLIIDNLFDRKDITSHSTSEYYTFGRTFQLGYKMNL
jgi:iron complex outermembrane receptor protein